MDLKHDAVQDISYQGILDCYEQGNTLLGKYQARLVSVHDPDEYALDSFEVLPFFTLVLVVLMNDSLPQHK